MLGEIESKLEELKAQQETLADSENEVKDSKLLSFYIRIMAKVTDSERCSIFIYDPNKESVWLKAGTGFEERGIEVPVKESIAGQAILSGETIIVSDMTDRPSASKTIEKLTVFVTRNVLCVPIKSPTHDKATGAFQLLNKKNDQEFNQEDISLAEEIAEHLQLETDRIYLDQEVFELVERHFAPPGKIASIVIAGVILIFLFSIFLLAASSVLAMFVG